MWSFTVIRERRVSGSPMGDNWITDMTHFLDHRGQLPANYGSKRIANHLGSIVTALTHQSIGHAARDACLLPPPAQPQGLPR